MGISLTLPRTVIVFGTCITISESVKINVLGEYFQKYIENPQL